MSAQIMISGSWDRDPRQAPGSAASARDSLSVSLRVSGKEDVPGDVSRTAAYVVLELALEFGAGGQRVPSDSVVQLLDLLF